jgi:hypothetical protein
VTRPLPAFFDSVTTGSPLWLRLVDAFTGRPPQGPVSVRLELRRGTDWEPLAWPHHLTGGGDLGFVGLGRSGREPAQTFDVRVTVTAPRTQPATTAGDDRVTATLSTWSEASPPRPVPTQVTFFPTTDYSYGANVPVLTGQVLDAAGDPVARAEVTVTETVGGSPVDERALTDTDGWFRLPVRWSAGATQVDATSGALTGSLAFTVPDDLAAVARITVT